MATQNLSLADLRQDIAGAVPVELVQDWNDHERSAAQHARLLERYRVRGTILATDSAGLSKLSQQCTLAQVMKLVSEPKEVLHAHLTAIGGEAIGVWAADNSQMFFPESVDPQRILTGVLAVQRRANSLTVKIGAGLHTCECYKVGGGLFGEEADFIEEIAENQTKGGEVVVTQPFYDRLDGALREAAQRRDDLKEHGTLWSWVDYQGPVEFTPGDDIDYPIPFDATFFRKLRRSSLAELAAESFSDYRKESIVVFMKITHRPHSLLLDAFTDRSLTSLAIHRIAGVHGGDVVKSTGALAIVLFPPGQAAAAVAFAREASQATRALGFHCSAGITQGEVFLFPLAGGGREIAGNPVNIGSKLSEDSGLEGILVDSSATAGLCEGEGEPFRVTISRVEMAGLRFPM